MVEIYREQLDNGLTLLVAEQHRLPLVCSTVWYRVGSREEKEGFTGLSHFLEHMMFKGSRRFPKGSLDALSLRLGGQNNAFTSYDYTCYYFTFAADRWEVALDVEADRMRRLLLPPDEFASEKQVVLEELHMGEDNPWEFLRRHVRSLAYQRHPYRHPIIGWEEDLRAITLEQMRAYYDFYYQPGNAVVAIAGDVDPKRVSALVRRKFGCLKGQSLPRQPLPPDSPPDGRVRFHASRPAHATRLLMAFHGPALSADSIHAVHLLDYILSEGKTCRLYQRLVEEDQTVSSISVHFEDMKDPGLFALAAQLKDGASPEKVEEAVAEELGRIRRDGVTKAEMAKARRQLEADFIFELEDASGLAMNIGMYECLHTAEFFQHYLDRMKRVTAADVQAAARAYLDPDRAVVGCLEASKGKGQVVVEAEEDLELPDSRQGYHRAACGRPAPADRSPRGRTSGTAVHLDIRERRLANGLTVLACPWPQIPAVLLHAVVLAGSREDRTGVEGLAHLVGNMLDEGTPKRSWREIADWVDGCGGSLDAFGNREASGLSLKVLKEDLPAGLKLVRELLYESIFPKDRLEQTRSQVLTHIAAREDRPDYLGAREFNRIIYAGTPLAHPTFGYADTVRKFKRGQLQAFHARYYHPANTVLVAVGDFDPDRFLDTVEKDWGGLPAGKRLDRKALPLARQTGPVTRVVPVRDKEQLHVYLGHLGVRRSHPDFYRLMVMDVILGAGPGFTARIPHKIRDEMGLAYHTYASICAAAGLDEGRFTAYLGTSPQHRDRAIQAILKEIRRIRREPVGADELAGARDYLTGSFVFHFETMGLIANFVLTAWLYGLGFDYPEKFARYIEEVSAADVLAAAKRHLDPDNLTIVEVVPETARGASRR